MLQIFAGKPWNSHIFQCAKINRLLRWRQRGANQESRYAGMHQVFISYNNADRHLVPELSQALESAGYSTWYYDRDTQVGFQYLDYVGATIVDCHAMVLLISPRSVRSTQVNGEIVRAYEEKKSILPVLCGMNYVEFQ